MFRVPRQFKRLMDDLTTAFPRIETARRVMFFLAAAILVHGARTVSGVLRLLAIVERVNPSTFHRVFSQRRWSSWRLAKVIASFVIERFAQDGVIRIVGDETVDGHRGKRVYGKARHRDAVRSSHSHTAFRYGHKWIVLAILVDLPYTHRPLALPLLIALYRDPTTNQKEGRVHKTPAELMSGLLAVMLHWFPRRNFVFAGDNAYGTHPMSRFAQRHRRQLTLVSKIVADANLFKQPPKRAKKQVGRPRVKGAPLPAPCEVVGQRKRKRKLKVNWYGGGTRHIEIVTETGNWFKSGKGLVPIRWVYVKDLTGTHRDEYFFSTNPNMSASDIIEHDCRRWNIETTFQELREHLGLEKTRGWHQQTVLRMAPCLFLLYTLITVFYDTLPESSIHFRRRNWFGKTTITFSDTIANVRHYLWFEWIFECTPSHGGVRKLPPTIRKLLDFGLTQAA